MCVFFVLLYNSPSFACYVDTASLRVMPGERGEGMRVTVAEIEVDVVTVSGQLLYQHSFSRGSSVF